MKIKFLAAALFAGLTVFAQNSDTTAVEAQPVEAPSVEEVAAPVRENYRYECMNYGIAVMSLLDDLNAGLLSSEEATVKADSLIDYHRTRLNQKFAEVAYEEQWTEEFSAAYDSTSADTVAFDFDWASMMDEWDSESADVIKKSSFEWHIGPNTLLLGDRAVSSTAGQLRPVLSMENRFVFSNKRKIGGASSPVVLQTGWAVESNHLSWQGNQTLVKDWAQFNGSMTVLEPVSNVNSIRTSSTTMTSLELPLMIHLDFSPKGSIGESFSIGAGAYGKWRMTTQNRVGGKYWDNSFFQTQSSNDFNMSVFSYGFMGQIGYKNVMITGRLEQTPLFLEGSFAEEVFLASLNLGVSL